MATITLSDIQTYAQITLNIEGRMIDPHILLSRRFDVEPVVTKALMTAVDAAIATPESAPQLEAFYTDYVIPYWCLEAYRRFLTEHGTNVTQFGVTVARDPRGTFDQADDKRRAEILRQKAHDSDILKAYMTDRLNEVNYTFDGVVFLKSETIDKREGYINSVRKRPRNPYTNDFYSPYDKWL